MAENYKDDLTDEQKTALKACVNQLERDDQFIRERNIRQWKKSEEYWRLNQFIYWDDMSMNYQDIQTYNAGDNENDQVPPKTFGIYRAYGESIIAAMSAAIPSVLFFPDDTDNPDDITTAKAYSRISELVQRHNKAPLLFIKMLALMYNQGLVATHVSWDDDEKHGVVKTPEYKDEELKLQEVICPRCNNVLGNETLSDEEKISEDNQDANEYKDEITEQEQQDVEKQKIFEKIYKCDNCGYEGQAEAGRVFDTTIPRLSGYSNTPKGRINIKAYGPLNVRISSFAKTQEDIGLLELQLEMHYAAARDEFPEIADKIQASSDFYSYERWGRTSSELLTDQLYNQVTVRYCWMRPWGFESYGTRDGSKDHIIKVLKRKYPHGCCVVMVNDVLARVYDESMDDYWSVSCNPLDSFIHGVPMGKPALDVQDALNEVKNLSLQKHQFGISETFVDSGTIDEDSYRSQQAGPGYVTFAQALAGRSLSDSFYQTRTAAMNEEDLNLQQTLNTDAQFLIGAVPSIFGGNQVSGSKTASEYNQSRNFALQRLGNQWINMKFLWADTMSKAARLFATKMVEDEKYVRKNGNTFETVWIKKAELTGKVGNVEPDPSEQFPLSWSQKRDLFMQMITMQNPVIGEIMLHPNNAQNTKDALGFPEFYIPGEENRSKQLIELRKLILVDPQSFPPDSPTSTVPIDPTVDEHEVHIAVIKLWCVSEPGLYIKETNPAAYANVLLHLKDHMTYLQMTQPPAPQEPTKVSKPQQQPKPAAKSGGQPGVQ